MVHKLRSFLFIFCFLFLTGCSNVQMAESAFISEPPVTAEISGSVVQFAETTKANAPKFTVEQENALKSAQSYLRHMAFSRSGLIDQLLYEKYSQETTVWAVDNIDANWMSEALECAQSYISHSAFSYVGLINQLDYEGFTVQEATFGADNCGADWNQEALECAESYLAYSSFSKAALEDQLEYEGFTSEQIAYAIAGVGY